MMYKVLPAPQAPSSPGLSQALSPDCYRKARLRVCEMEWVLTQPCPPPRAGQLAGRAEAGPLHSVSIYECTGMGAPPQGAQDLPVPFSTFSSSPKPEKQGRP